jgi:hypothetical protein
MKLAKLTGSRPAFRDIDRLVESMLCEDQFDYLSRKYPEVDPDAIRQAIEIDRRAAEKLVLGLQKGVISSLEDPEAAVTATAELDPFTKVSKKSEADEAYAQQVAKAKEINPTYWQWIIRAWKENPEQQFDPSWFHYLEGNDLKTEDLLGSARVPGGMTPEQVATASARWHEEQFAQQKVAGQYDRNIDDPEAVPVDGFFFVPVGPEDAQREGSKMQNCIGRYVKPSNTTKIWSMRNRFNNPHVSVSLEVDKSAVAIREIKGKQNKKPVDRYIPPIIEFVKILLKNDNVQIGIGSDFWNLSQNSSIKIPYAEFVESSTHPVRTGARFAVELSTEIVDRILLNHAKRDREDVHDLKRLVPRMSPEAAEKLAPGASLEFVKLMLKHHKLLEKTAVELAESGTLKRAGRLIVLASYKPDQFIEQLKKTHPEDLTAAFGNYRDAIEAYPHRDPFFTEIFTHLGPQQYRHHTNDPHGSLLPKMPVPHLMRLITDNLLDEYHLELRDVIKAAGMDLARASMDGKIKFLSILPDGAELGQDETQRLVMSTPPNDWMRLYESAPEGQIKNTIWQALVTTGRLERSPEEAEHYGSLVHYTTNPRRLLELRRKAPKRVKRLIDRKLARMERMAV